MNVNHITRLIQPAVKAAVSWQSKQATIAKGSMTNNPSVEQQHY